MTRENGQKFTIEGEQFTFIDLAKDGYSYGVHSNDRYFGKHRTTMLTADGKGDQQSWEAPAVSAPEYIVASLHGTRQACRHRPAE